MKKQTARLLASLGLLSPVGCSVGPFMTGMRVEIPLHKAVLQPGASAESIWELLNDRYADEPLINVVPIEDALAYSDPAFDPRARKDTAGLEIPVVPDDLGPGPPGTRPPPAPSAAPLGPKPAYSERQFATAARAGLQT